jgi:hypothetical protein
VSAITFAVQTLVDEVERIDEQKATETTEKLWSRCSVISVYFVCSFARTCHAFYVRPVIWLGPSLQQGAIAQLHDATRDRLGVLKLTGGESRLILPGAQLE